MSIKELELLNFLTLPLSLRRCFQNICMKNTTQSSYRSINGVQEKFLAHYSLLLTIKYYLTL